MCKGPGARASGKVGSWPGAQRVTSVQKGGQDVEEFCLILKSTGNDRRMLREDRAAAVLLLACSNLLLERSLCLNSLYLQCCSGLEEREASETWPVSQVHKPGEDMETQHMRERKAREYSRKYSPLEIKREPQCEMCTLKIFW